MKVTVNGDGVFSTTITEFSKRIGVDYAIANCLVRFLVAQGVARDSGEVITAPNGKGKGSKVYTLPSAVTLEF